MESDSRGLVRTFISVNFSEEIKKNLSGLLSDLEKTAPYIKWVKEANAHLTLKFLGEIPFEDLNKVYSGCSTAVKGIKSFVCYCEELGVFPSRTSPRVIWLGIKKGETELKKTAFQLETCLHKEGFPRENREFQSHLTLGRMRKECDSRARKNLWNELFPYVNFKLGEISVDKICVMKSVLHSSGPEYSVLKEIELGKTDL